MACLISRDFSIKFQVFYFISLFHQVPPIIPLLFPFQGPLFFLQYHRLSTGIFSPVWEYRLAQSSVLHLPQIRKKRIQLECLLEEWKSESKTHTKKKYVWAKDHERKPQIRIWWGLIQVPSMKGNLQSHMGLQDKFWS